MKTTDAIALATQRDRDLLAALEDERDQGMPAPFDWTAWRRNRAVLIDRQRAARDWARPRLPLFHEDRRAA